MSDRPTYKDYLFHREGSYIRSGGQYYTIVKEKMRIGDWGFAAIIIAAAVVLMWLIFSDLIWVSWLSDFLLLTAPLHILAPKLHYRRTRFETVIEGSEAWQKAAALKYSPSDNILATVFYAVSLVFLLVIYTPGSFIISSIRSQLDGGGGIVSAEFSQSGTGAFYEDESVTEKSVPVPVSDLSGTEVDIYITVIHTPDTALLSLNGKPLPQEHQPGKRITTIFDSQDYFKQETRFPISDELLHDGSTLTLTCGSLTREWVFRLAA